MKIRPKFLFRPRDAWVGVFVGKREDNGNFHPDGRAEWRDIYICLLPFVPLRIRCYYTVPDVASYWTLKIDIINILVVALVVGIIIWVALWWIGVLKY